MEDLLNGQDEDVIRRGLELPAQLPAEIQKGIPVWMEFIFLTRPQLCDKRDLDLVRYIKVRFIVPLLCYRVFSR